MLSVLLEMLFVLQPEATGAPAGSSGAGGAGAGPLGGCGGADGQIFMLVGLFAMMYFLIIRPQRTQQKKHDEMQKGLSKGDVVRTDSGIRGEILSLNDRDAVLLIDAKTKITILRARIAGPDAVTSDKAKDDAEKSKDKDKEG